MSSRLMLLKSILAAIRAWIVGGQTVERGTHQWGDWWVLWKRGAMKGCRKLQDVRWTHRSCSILRGHGVLIKMGDWLYTSESIKCVNRLRIWEVGFLTVTGVTSTRREKTWWNPVLLGWNWRYPCECVTSHWQNRSKLAEVLIYIYTNACQP